MDGVTNPRIHNTAFPKLSPVKELLMGFCLGTANIIPGVSGGTFLLIFGVYERVFIILNRINKRFLVGFVSLVFSLVKSGGQKGTSTALMSFLKEMDLLFLIKLAIGAVIAILALSGLMKYLLVHHFVVTYALFMGLILVSIIIPVKMLQSFNPWVIFFVLLGMGLTIAVSCMVNPYDKVKIKSDSLEHQVQAYPGALEKIPTATGETLTAFSFSGKYAMEDYLYIALCGAVAVSAMVLPGISGSLVMILMGTYFDVISAISALKTLNLDTFVFLGAFSLGMGVGGLLFARLISFVLNRYYNTTMAFLIGLMAGSLYALWPFKQVVVMARQYIKQEGGVTILENVAIHTNINILPNKEDPLILALICFLVGCVIMVGFVRAESSNP